MQSAAAAMMSVTAARAPSVMKFWHQRPLLRRVVVVVVVIVVRGGLVVVRVVRRWRGRGRRWPAVVPVAFAVRVVVMIMAEAEYHFRRYCVMGGFRCLSGFDVLVVKGCFGWLLDFAVRIGNIWKSGGVRSTMVIISDLYASPSIHLYKSPKEEGSFQRKKAKKRGPLLGAAHRMTFPGCGYLQICVEGPGGDIYSGAPQPRTRGAKNSGPGEHPC